ncbi:hypothetical protein Taro_012093 [Colocasia esculenta]|uniref:DNA-directed RNA polymerase n=1 Tax=Colocasia esculenta TaxID=4460 RepID=A0A843U831_COLES|nr:hypothetical protein [Colocasia esculenta]
MMHCPIFMGPTFYQRLIHMAEDKVKFRNTRPMHPLTRQIVADRKIFGGFRFEEIERDCLLAHGAAANLHKRLFTVSDSSQMHVYQTCTRVANVIQWPVPGGKKVRGPYYPFCQSSENIVKISVPYGAKLLYQELFSMLICLKFKTEEEKAAQIIASAAQVVAGAAKFVGVRESREGDVVCTCDQRRRRRRRRSQHRRRRSWQGQRSLLA